MRLSLNELEVVVHKAALGVGLPVGHAEEAARFAGWLARAGFEPATPLLRDLSAVEAGRAAQAASRCLPTLCDRQAADLGAGARSVILEVPLLAAAAVATAAVDLGVALRAGWRGGSGQRVEATASDALLELRAAAEEDLVSAGPAEVTFEAGLPAGHDEALPLRLDHAGFLAARRRAIDRGVSVEPASWAGLARLAERILVPRSEQSRVRGAGAGDIDRDI